MAQLFEGLPSLLQSRSQLLVRRFGCGFQTLIGEYHAWGSLSLHQKNLYITLRYLLAVRFGRRAFWTPFGRPIGHSLLRHLHHGSVCSSPATLSWARQMWSGRSHSPNMIFGRKYALHHGMIIIRSTWPMMTKDAVYDLGGISKLSFPLIFIMRKVLITWGIQGAPSRFSSLHFHLSGSIPGPSSNSYQKFQSYCRIQLLCSCITLPPLASGIPVPQVPA